MGGEALPLRPRRPTRSISGASRKSKKNIGESELTQRVHRRYRPAAPRRKSAATIGVSEASSALGDLWVQPTGPAT